MGSSCLKGQTMSQNLISYKLNGIFVIPSVNDMRKKIALLADAIGRDLDPVDCPVTHRFAKGCYLREIFMPAGAVVVGKIHATEHFNVVLTGEVTVVTATTKERIRAPHTFISGPGVQKVVFVHEDCRWQTLHVTDKTDLDEIEKEVIAESYDQLEVDSLLQKLEQVKL